DGFVRGLGAKPAPAGRNLLVFATPRKALTDTRWDMGGWYLDTSGLAAADAALVVAKRPVWLVVARPAVADGAATLHAVVALRRLLD
ncbi:MAG: hypothetical protein K8M05_33150, partial [Deltaproteobacteria bacterium]|nr:hypothetical protein [Kofleriaceae bacterium]